jgi:replicative DNA helicase
MELVSDEEGFIYFNELLYRAMRRVYGESRVKNKILVEHEIRTMKKIEEIKLKMKKKSWQQEKTNAAQVNPFMLQMYMNISFKAWLKSYRDNLHKRKSSMDQDGGTEQEG